MRSLGIIYADESSGRLAQNPVSDWPTDFRQNEIGICLESLLSSWERMDGRTRMILDRRGKVLASSGGLHSLVDRNKCLVFKPNGLLYGTGSSANQLRRVLEVASGELETVTLAKPSSSGHYIITATGIGADIIAVAVRDTDAMSIAKLANMEEAFGLTRCEVLVIEKLINGQVPRQIATQLAISVHTVRAHLRHCYDKLQVSSREELWQRLAPYCLN